MHTGASAATPTTCSACAAPGHPLDPHPEEQKTATPGTGVDPDLNVEEEGANIKARKVRKTPQKKKKPKPQQQHIHAINNLLSELHI